MFINILTSRELWVGTVGILIIVGVVLRQRQFKHQATKIIELIESHGSEGITLGDLARNLKMTPERAEMAVRRTIDRYTQGEITTHHAIDLEKLRYTYDARL